MSTQSNRGSVDRTSARFELAQAVMHLDWRVSSLTEELSLSERQIPTVRMILANEMASCLASGHAEHRDGRGAAERLEALLSHQQRKRLAALSRQQREFLVPCSELRIAGSQAAPEPEAP